MYYWKISRCGSIWFIGEWISYEEFFVKFFCVLDSNWDKLGKFFFVVVILFFNSNFCVLYKVSCNLCVVWCCFWVGNDKCKVVLMGNFVVIEFYFLIWFNVILVLLLWSVWFVFSWIFFIFLRYLFGLGKKM